MHRRPLSIAAACMLLFMTTAAAPGQVPQHVATPQDVLSKGTLTVHVLGSDNRSLKQQAFVSLYKMGSGVPLGTVLTERSPEAVFSDMPGFGRYTVAASSAGYGTESKDFDYSYVRVQVDITKHPLSGADATSTPAPALPPNAQKHVQNRLDAMQAGKLQEAQKELIAAYNAAPKNADVCYLPGVAYLKSKDFPHAQTYLGMATSIDPKNVPALVALGQLRHEQKDYDAAIKPLEKAASLDSKEWLAR